MTVRAACLMTKTTIATAIEIRLDRRIVVAIVKASAVAGLALLGIA